MASYMRGEILKVLFGAPRWMRKTLHQCRELDDKYIFPPPDKIANYSAKQVKEFAMAVLRYNALSRYWEFQRVDKLPKYKSAQELGLCRDTLREWENRYAKYGWRGLLPYSRARHQSPPRTARTKEVEAFIIDHRTRYADGKEVLCEYLRRSGYTISEASVSRVIREQKAVGKIEDLASRALALMRRRSQRRPYAKRRKGRADASLSSVQMDHKHAVIHGTGIAQKVFCARNTATRAVYMTAASNATAAAATRALLAAEQEMGVTINEIQTDNGSEFRGIFEETCRQLGKRQFLIPVKSPKWNSLVENAFGYLEKNLLTANPSIIPTVPGLQHALDEHCQRYNNKPNIALRYICPKTRQKRLLTPNEMRYNLLLYEQDAKAHPLPNMC